MGYFPLHNGNKLGSYIRRICLCEIVDMLRGVSCRVSSVIAMSSQWGVVLVIRCLNPLHVEKIALQSAHNGFIYAGIVIYYFLLSLC